MDMNCNIRENPTFARGSIEKPYGYLFMRFFIIIKTLINLYPVELIRPPYSEFLYEVDIITPSPTPPLKGGVNLLSSPLRGEGKGEGV